MREEPEPRTQGEGVNVVVVGEGETVDGARYLGENVAHMRAVRPRPPTCLEFRGTTTGVARVGKAPSRS